MSVIDLFRGFKGHPSHPPLTDAAIGAYSAGSLMVLVGWLGFQEEKMAVGGFLAIAAGLIFAIPTVITGFADYIQIPRGTGMRRTANLHWVCMVLATSAYLWADALLQEAFDTSRISGLAALATLIAFALLMAGGYLGGAIVFVYGMRVQNDPPSTPTGEAVKPKFPPD